MDLHDVFVRLRMDVAQLEDPTGSPGLPKKVVNAIQEVVDTIAAQESASYLLQPHLIAG